MEALASLNLSRNSLKEKVLLYSKFYFENQVINLKMCKKKYLSCVYDMDRKIRHTELLFGITRQASWCRSVTLVTDFSIHTMHPWKILIIFH